MKRQASSNDLDIGNKIRARRKLLKFSPQQFASILGISYQQLYKYENGQNRVSAVQLAKIARVLNLPVTYFFSENTVPLVEPALNDSFRASQIANEPETSSLVKHYISIRDPRTRMALVELVASINKYLKKSVS